MYNGTGNIWLMLQKYYIFVTIALFLLTYSKYEIKYMY